MSKLFETLLVCAWTSNIIISIVEKLFSNLHLAKFWNYSDKTVYSYVHPNNIFIGFYERALTISVIECANRNKSSVDSFQRGTPRTERCTFRCAFLSRGFRVKCKSQRARFSESRERFSWRNVPSHVANIKLIWRCLNTARGKFVRGFANLVKFKYYVLITHKVLRPRTSALLRA